LTTTVWVINHNVSVVATVNLERLKI